jgi:hypothetical protein
MEFQPNDVDRKAALALYVERITRIVLNQVVRPFTAEWHRRSLQGDLSRRPHRSRGHSLPTSTPAVFLSHRSLDREQLMPLHASAR